MAALGTHPDQMQLVHAAKKVKVKILKVYAAKKVKVEIIMVYAAKKMKMEIT